MTTSIVVFQMSLTLTCDCQSNWQKTSKTKRHTKLSISEQNPSSTSQKSTKLGCAFSVLAETWRRRISSNNTSSSWIKSTILTIKWHSLMTLLQTTLLKSSTTLSKMRTSNLNTKSDLSNIFSKSGEQRAWRFGFPNYAQMMMLSS